MRTYNQVKNISESYAKIMRDNFPLSFENEELNNLLCNITFDDEKSLFAAAIKDRLPEFKTYIYSHINVEDKKVEENRSVKELLASVGYDFHICKTRKDIEQFRDWYKPGEELCTFNNIGSRLSSYSIFWITKGKNTPHLGVDRTRQDSYGTSCCSIQINNRDISIKNRYNHAVNSPDATFLNNLDNIVSGLTDAFTREFGFKIEKNTNTLEVDKFILKNGKYMYYNYEINNIYYGINKIYKNGELTVYSKDKYYLLDYYLLNLQESKIEKIDTNINDAFFDLKFKKIMITKNIESEDEDGVLTVCIGK